MADSLDRSALESLVPALRRYARAAVGDAERADTCAARALEAAFAAAPAERTTPTALYRALHDVLREEPVVALATADAGDAERVAGGVRALAPALRHAFLLARLEGLAVDDVAAVMGLSTAEVESCLGAAREELRGRLLASVLIIEDNFLVAEHLAAVVEGLGHDVIDVAATADEAIAAATRRTPDVVLADVELGSAGSGIDAIAAIRAREPVPAVYVTAFPERVLAAGQAEPTFVVAKPFDEQRLKIAVAAALGPDPHGIGHDRHA